MVTARMLHNYVIDNDNLNFEKATTTKEYRVVPWEGMGTPKYNRGFLPVLPTREKEKGTGVRRAEILEEIEGRDMRRPLHNRLCNQELDDEIVYANDG